MIELLGGRRRPFFVESRNGVIQDVITPNFVDVTNSQGQIVMNNRYPFPYAIVLQDNGQPVIVAVKYRPKSRVKIAPVTELVVQ